MEDFKRQALETVKPMYDAFLEAAKPAIEAYAPIHKVLSQPVVGPFSWYFVIIIAFQILANFWPCKLVIQSSSRFIALLAGGKHTVTASHILVKEEDTCKDLKEKIKKGASFEEV